MRSTALAETVDVLALDAEGQVAALRTMFDWVDEVGPGFNVDELALQFHDFVMLLPQVVDADMVSTEAAKAVWALDAQLDRMSGQEQAELWTVIALRNSAEWTKVRELQRLGWSRIPAVAVNLFP